eukprot:gene9575-6730_t
MGWVGVGRAQPLHGHAQGRPGPSGAARSHERKKRQASPLCTVGSQCYTRRQVTDVGTSGAKSKAVTFFLFLVRENPMDNREAGRYRHKRMKKGHDGHAALAPNHLRTSIYNKKPEIINKLHLCLYAWTKRTSLFCGEGLPAALSTATYSRTAQMPAVLRLFYGYTMLLIRQISKG